MESYQLSVLKRVGESVSTTHGEKRTRKGGDQSLLEEGQNKKRHRLKSRTKGGERGNKDGPLSL